MNASAGAVRMNISVPGDVKRTMEATTEAVNWSKVAAEAFRGKLLELQSQRKGATMEEVLNRLRAAAEVEEGEARAAGHKAGESWAKEDAKPSELRRLYSAVFEAPNAPNDVDAFVSDLNEGGREVGILSVMTGQIYTDAENVLGQLGNALARMKDSHGFAVGFVDGATDVWHNVREQL